MGCHQAVNCAGCTEQPESPAGGQARCGPGAAFVRGEQRWRKSCQRPASPVLAPSKRRPRDKAARRNLVGLSLSMLRPPTSTHRSREWTMLMSKSSLRSWRAILQQLLLPRKNKPEMTSPQCRRAHALIQTQLPGAAARGDHISSSCFAGHLPEAWRYHLLMRRMTMTWICPQRHHPLTSLLCPAKAQV